MARDGTQAAGIGSAESQPLNHQGSPLKGLFLILPLSFWPQTVLGCGILVGVWQGQELGPEAQGKGGQEAGSEEQLQISRLGPRLGKALPKEG